MGNDQRRPSHPENPEEIVSSLVGRRPPPRPNPAFRRRAWRIFQRTIDPLAAPRPLRPPRH